MTSDVVLGIDLGTSSVRATLIGPDGCPIATAIREYPVDSPHPGWSEQHPDTWWQSTCSAVSATLAAADGPEVCAISFSGQMHGTVLCNANGKPIRPAIIWSDQRSSREVTTFRSVLEPGRLAELTANPLAAGFQLATLLWLRGNEPESLDAARYVFLPKDWLRFHMTGVAATDPSDACSTLMFDTANRSWSETVIEASGIDGEKLPRVAESFGLSGTLLPTAAHELGLREGVPMFVGAGDTPATAFGNGVVDPGTVQCTIGSGGQLIAPLGTPKYDAELRTHTFCHVPRDRWYAMAAILSAGLSLRWLRGCMFGTDAPSYAELSAMAESVPVGAEGLFFLPHLTGERTPHLDANACGVFFGLTPRHTRAHLIRAVMEGVVFALDEGLDVLRSLSVAPERIIAAGGGARSDLWRQVQADVFGVPVERAPLDEAAAYGAALIAGIGIGWWTGRDDVPATGNATSHVLTPDETRREQYAELKTLYRQLYPNLRELMAERARIAKNP